MKIERKMRQRDSVCVRACVFLTNATLLLIYRIPCMRESLVEGRRREVLEHLLLQATTVQNALLTTVCPHTHLVNYRAPLIF